MRSEDKITVDIYGEDETSGGLQDFLFAAAQELRLQLGKSPLILKTKKWGSAKGNAALLKQCEKYELRRFQPASGPRIDHIFYVIDAKNADNSFNLEGVRPGPTFASDLERLCGALCALMTQRARGDQTDASWNAMKSGFHPFVLVWERESLILPVADRLGMGAAHQNSYEHQGAAGWVTTRWREHKGESYQKSTTGKQLLDKINVDGEMRRIILEANASVRQIVETMAEL